MDVQTAAIELKFAIQNQLLFDLLHSKTITYDQAKAAVVLVVNQREEELKKINEGLVK